MFPVKVRYEYVRKIINNFNKKYMLYTYKQFWIHKRTEVAVPKNAASGRLKRRDPIANALSEITRRRIIHSGTAREHTFNV